jgi:glycosyltransferase involved in cell wall biosynthesis
MKIAFDLRRIQKPGVGRYMTCLTEAVMAHAPEHAYLLILPPGEEGAIAVRQSAEKVISSAPCYSLREQFELPRLLRRHKIDLVHSLHFNLPLFSPCPAVVTIHDVIYLACKQDLPSRWGRLYYRTMMTAAVRRADRVITVSEFSKSEIVRYLGAEPEKISVIHSGVDRDFQPVIDAAKTQAAQAKYGIDGAYILYAGIHKLRKNHAGLMRAFREFLKSGENAQLVIAGPMSEGEDELRELARELEIAHRVVFTGFVPDSDLRTLYSAARVYACPSLYEGFGFTVLEAMACGVPVVCSRESSLPEVAGDAALYADPRIPQEYALALRQVFDDVDLRRQLIERGFRNRLRFSWEHAAIATLAAYQLAAALRFEFKTRAQPRTEVAAETAVPEKRRSG